MKYHSSDYKNNIKEMGRQLSSKIIWNDEEYDGNYIYSAFPSFHTDLLKSVMKELIIETSIYIPLNEEINYQFGLLVNDEYEWLNFGMYVIYSSEYNEDTKTYRYTCYDKMLYSMKDYTGVSSPFPMSVRDYLIAICNVLDIPFSNANDEFCNYNRIIPSERFLANDGSSLGYTIRDVLDNLSQVTASNIIINENDELELRYIYDTYDTIDAESLNSVNVKFKEKFGAINTIVLSRSEDSDSIFYPATVEDERIEFKIRNNVIMNYDDRSDYIQDIYSVLNGLEFYTTDYISTGITYYDVMDLYNVSIEDEEGNSHTYKCLMLNDEINLTNGLTENIYCEMPQGSETNYNISTQTDKTKLRTTLIVDKVNGQIEATVERVNDVSEEVNKTLETIKAQYEYRLTTDETYQEGKTYYIYNQDENIYERYDDYNIGDYIPENAIYEYIKVKDSISDDLNNKYEEIINKFVEYSPTSQITSIVNKVVSEQTDTYKKDEIQQIVNGTGVDGVTVTSVKVSNEALFDINGMHYNRSGASAKSTINQNGLEVDSTGSEGVYLYSGYVADNDTRFNTSTRNFQGSSIVYTKNLKTSGDTIVGNHCLIMDYEDEGYQGTGWFNI